MATDFVSLITETYGGSRNSLVFARTGTMTTNMLRSFFHIHYFQLRCFTVSSHDKQSNTHTCMIIDPPDSPSIRMFLPFLNCKFKPVCEISRRKGMGKGGGRQEMGRQGEGRRRAVEHQQNGGWKKWKWIKAQVENCFSSLIPRPFPASVFDCLQ